MFPLGISGNSINLEVPVSPTVPSAPGNAIAVMASTPFSAFANATLTFQLPIQVIENDALGNPQAITEDFVLKAYLKPAASNTRNVNPFDAGQDNVMGVEGRCVEPTSLPADIVPGVKAIATIGGVEGEFYLEAAIPSAFGVDDVLGASLKGRFVTSVTWGESL